MSKDGTLRMNLEPELLARIDELIGPVSKSVAVQELGTRVSRHLVSRIALLRGIRLMEQQYSEGTEIVAHEEPKVEPQVPAADKPKAKKQEEPVEMEYDESGFLKKPDGWDLWTSSSVPAGHQEMHDYYSQLGWSKYTGKAGKEIISFYWCNDPSLHEVAPYDVVDKDGKKIITQKTPYGPGHMIPYGYTGSAA
tara:strand:- start:1152 stop:1733 length:582 start_codon:yes stop_codon:yes gene_type:complete